MWWVERSDCGRKEKCESNVVVAVVLMMVEGEKKKRVMMTTWSGRT